LALPELSFTVADKVLSVLPSWIVSRYYSMERLERELRFELAADRPMLYTLGTYVPGFTAQFNVTNFTSLTWKVHDFRVRILAQSQPFGTAETNGRPAPIKPKTVGTVLVHGQLSDSQTRRLLEQANVSLRMPTTLYVTAQMESKLGIVEFEPSFNNRPAEIMR